MLELILTKIIPITNRKPPPAKASPKIENIHGPLLGLI